MNQVIFFNNLLSILQDENLDSVDNIILVHSIHYSTKKAEQVKKKEVSYLLCRRLQK